MEFPKFGLFYFPDSNSVRVDSTDIIRIEHRRLGNRVNNREQIHNEDDYVEVCLPSRSRNGEAKTLAAKILFLGDNFKDMVEKKAAFLRNEDIWHSSGTTSAVRRKSAKSTATQDDNEPKRKQKKATGRQVISSSDDETDIDSPPAFGTSKPKMMKAAKDRVLSQLKSSLMNKRPRTSTPLQSEEEDVDIDTNVDLFDTPQCSGTADPCDGQQGMESGQMSQALENIDRHQDVMDALKEIPSLVKCVKELTTTMQRLLPSFDSDTSSGSSSPAPEMISLGNSTVMVNRKCYQRLNRSRMSLFAQDLAVLLFGRETLAASCLTGNGSQKEPLDAEKLNVLVDTVMSEFPGTNTSEVRAIIRRKCNNESFSRKKV